MPRYSGLARNEHGEVTKWIRGLGRSVHAGDLLSLSLLPQLFSALRAESETQKRHAKRLAFLERDIRLVRQLGLIGTTLSA
jgi:hypothetical protein